MNICFTGHRPNKLGGYDWNTPKNKAIMDKLQKHIINIIVNSDDTTFRFICGGALGIDQMAFSICQYLRGDQSKWDTPVKIKLVLAIPFEKQDCKWSQDSVNIFRQQRKNADEVILVDTLENYKFDAVKTGEYHPAKMQLRNMYMVDRADLVIAVWDGTNGGTGNCVKYARKQNKQILIIDPNKL